MQVQENLKKEIEKGGYMIWYSSEYINHEIKIVDL